MGGLSNQIALDNIELPAAEFPAITPRSTRKSPERMLAHRARMAGKVLNRARAYDDRGNDRVHGTYPQARRHYALTSIAIANRRTDTPHLNAREIARNERQAAA